MCICPSFHIYIFILLNLIHFHAFCQFNFVICVFNLFLYFCSKTIWFFIIYKPKHKKEHTREWGEDEEE